LRKAGRLDEALALARDRFASTPEDLYLQGAYGWVLYDLVKLEAQAFEAEDTTPSHLAARFDELLREYFRLGRIERPGMLHSFLLKQVLKGSRVWPRFLRFARWWNPVCLRDEDKQPFRSDKGKMLPSLELQLAYAIGRTAIAHSGVGDNELIGWAESMVDAGLKAYPNDKWLPYYKSKLLIKKGRNSEAREFLRRVVQRQLRAGWAWSLFGRTFETEDRNKATARCSFTVPGGSPTGENSDPDTRGYGLPGATGPCSPGTR
jgi:hypothetical protein